MKPPTRGIAGRDVVRAQVGRRIVDQGPWQRDDHFRDRGVREKRADAAIENGAAGDRPQLLQFPAEPRAASGCGDDRTDSHV